MNYVESFDFYGVPAKQIPHILGKGAPATSTDGVVGCTYMDTNTGDTYKCVAVTGLIRTWVPTETPSKGVYVIDIDAQSRYGQTVTFSHNYDVYEIYERISNDELVVCRTPDDRYYYYAKMIPDNSGGEDWIGELEFCCTSDLGSKMVQLLDLRPGRGGGTGGTIKWIDIIPDTSIKTIYYATAGSDGGLVPVSGKPYPTSIFADFAAHPDRTYELRMSDDGMTYIASLEFINTDAQQAFFGAMGGSLGVFVTPDGVELSNASSAQSVGE